MTKTGLQSVRQGFAAVREKIKFSPELTEETKKFILKAMSDTEQSLARQVVEKAKEVDTETSLPPQEYLRRRL